MQAEYHRQYDEYEVRYHETKRCVAEVEVRLEALTAKREKLIWYLDLLLKQGPIRMFNETLWRGTIEQVWVLKGGTIRFIFKDGTKVEG